MVEIATIFDECECSFAVLNRYLATSSRWILPPLGTNHSPSLAVNSKSKIKKIYFQINGWYQRFRFHQHISFRIFNCEYYSCCIIFLTIIYFASFWWIWCTKEYYVLRTFLQPTQTTLAFMIFLLSLLVTTILCVLYLSFPKVMQYWQKITNLRGNWTLCLEGWLPIYFNGIENCTKRYVFDKHHLTDGFSSCKFRMARGII